MSALAFAADAPPELAAARTRYETAIAAANKPIQTRYIQDLQQLKSRAISMKNLDLAVALDAEIKAMAGAPTEASPSQTPTAAATSSRDFEKLLLNTVWRWNDKFNVTFQANGSAKDSVLKWKVQRPHKIEYQNGNYKGSITFDEQLTWGKIQETTPNGKPETMTLSRVQEHNAQ